MESACCGEGVCERRWGAGAGTGEWACCGSPASHAIDQKAEHPAFCKPAYSQGVSPLPLPRPLPMVCLPFWTGLETRLTV